MVATPTGLPDSIEDLRALVLAQQGELAEHEQTIGEYSEEVSQLREYIRLLKSQRFGTKSERTLSDQMGLFNEAEALCEEAASQGGAGDDGVTGIEVPAHTRKKRGGRKSLPDYLPREEVLHDVSEDEKVCGNDANHALTRIGEEKLEQLVFIPATAKVLVHIRPKYACSSCKDGITVAPPPVQPIPKSFASASLLAQIVTSKYVDALPLYRQAKIFERIGVELSRNTMASWVIRMGELVSPLTQRFLDEIRANSFVQCDETPFQVLKEDSKLATSSSYLWALRGGGLDRPLLYYEYDPTRGGEVPKRLLRSFEGFLQTDGYEGYTALGKEAGIVHVGCFAHARRKFDEALRGQKSSKGSKKKSKPGAKVSLARQGLDQINKLYKIERGYADAKPEERLALRREKLGPKLEALRTWTLASKDRVPPKSLAGKAIGYMDSQWPKLERVLEDGRLPLDTNAVERAIRPFVIGRRNWTFADTPKGAVASARLYSLVETAKANGLEPWAYLERIFEALPAATTEEDIEALLPWRIELPDVAGRVASR
ncbi:MAG: transposase [Hyphomicrobiaceae bacterium]|jgi:transposase